MDYLHSDPGAGAAGNIPAGPEDFNYGFDTFLQQQDEDMNYLGGEESSGSSNTLSDGQGRSPLMATSATLAPAAQHPLPTLAPAPTSTSQAYSPGTIALGETLVDGGVHLFPPAAGASTALAKQRMERRGHTKSRRGCFNCKRRRIKCQETRPACGHCIKTGLNCEYPAVPQVVHQPQHQIPIFSLQDMRLFQHFLLQCYPHYPIGAENVWTHEIPCLSQKYEYLMHAILGFAASELISEDPSLVESAMSHRLRAIKAIKKTLTDVPKAPPGSQFEEGNALMATCFALTFQSVWLDDGMTEYMTFIRGIVIVAYQMYMKGSRFLFGDFLGDKQTEVLEPFMRKVEIIPTEWALGAINGIRGLEPLLTDPTNPRDFDPNDPSGANNNSDSTGGGGNMSTERKYWELILDMAEKCLTSSWEAYKALTVHYGWWMMLPHDQFERLIDPSNQVAVLLATHWIALKQIMARITEVEKMGFSKVPENWKENNGSQVQNNIPGTGGGNERKHDMDVGMIRWLVFLNRSVELQYKVFNIWPEWVEAELDKDLGVFGRGSVRCGGVRVEGVVNPGSACPGDGGSGRAGA